MISQPHRRIISAAGLAALTLASPISARDEIDSLGLTRCAIFRIIEADISRNGLEARVQIDPAELIIQSALPPQMNLESLSIKSVAWDPDRQKIIFVIWAPQTPEIPPVEIGVRNQWPWIKTYAIELAADPNLLLVGELPSRRRPKPKILAKPGTPAVLMMSTPNMRITMDVLPLQPGSVGETIFVRDSATGRVLKAQVAAENVLVADF